MQGNKNDVSEPSQMSGSGHEDTSSAFLHSSKLRNKLTKLAAWRMDPSLIEFPAHSREFRGGFATVAQGFLAPSPRAEGAAKEIEKSSDEQLSSRAGNLQHESDIQNHGDDQRSKDGGADERKASGNNDASKWEVASKDDNAEHERHNQLSIPKIGHEMTPPEDMTYDVPGSGDRDIHSNRGIETRDQQPGREEGTDGQIVNGDSHKKRAETGHDRESGIKEQDGDGQTSKPKIVAVKKLKVENDADLERVLGMALRESEFLAELSHPNIVTLEGFVEDLSEQKIWDVTLGLEYLHNQASPIYHGDLKSLNILVNSECHALITDFGSARHLGDGYISKQLGGHEGPDSPQAAATDHNTVEEHITLEAFFSTAASTITLTGSSYTLRWAAPELLQDDKPCLGSDIWALGWIAYEVMTNTIPFHDIKKDAVVIKHVIQGNLPSITEHARMSLIRALCSLMVRCWSINPNKRPTADECRKLMSWMPMIVPAPTQALAEAPQLRHAQLLNKLGIMYNEQADYISAHRRFTAALDIYTNRNDYRGQGQTLCFLAEAHRFRYEYSEAVKLYSEALQIATELGDEGGRSDALFGLATTHLRRGEYFEAGKLYLECLQIGSNTGSKRNRANAIWGLAGVRRRQAEYREAIDLYSEALQIHTEVGNRRGRALNLCGLAGLHRDQGKYDDAANLYSEALQIYTDLGDHEERASTLFNHAMVHWCQLRYSEASKLYSESLQISTDIGDRHGRGAALCGLARVHSAVQEYDEATHLYSEALQIFTGIGDKHWRANTLMGYAKIIEVQGHLSEAASLYGEASEALEEIGDSSSASDALERASNIRKTIEGATAESTEAVKAGDEPSLT